jgi:hypothetical protein
MKMILIIYLLFINLIPAENTPRDVIDELLNTEKLMSVRM